MKITMFLKFNDQAKQIKPRFMSATMRQSAPGSRMPSPLPSPPPAPPQDEEMPDVVVDS